MKSKAHCILNFPTVKSPGGSFIWLDVQWGCLFRIYCWTQCLKTGIFLSVPFPLVCFCHIFIHIEPFLFPSIHSPFLFSFRCDITALLLYVEELMWSVCESPEALVRSNPSTAIAIIAGGSDWLYQIHSLCDQLLTVLVIVTAPLSLLYRFVCTVCFCY